MTVCPAVTNPRARSEHGSARAPLFESFFVAGFECSDHRLESGRRLDLLASTRHDELAALDYARVVGAGMTACRDGISWVRCERSPGVYCFDSWLPRLAASEGLLTVVWDLMHFGWPEHVDVFARNFPERFGSYARAVARFHRQHSQAAALFVPINEMSFLSWAGGDVACMNPFELARSTELKVQFVLATIAAIDAIREELPHARFIQSEPVINIVRNPDQPKTWRRVECDNLLQYEALDMLSGRRWARLGGDPKYLDVVGVNFYSDNQFTIEGTTVTRADPRYVPFSDLLLEVWRRYRRPMLVTETGAEGEARGPWLAYVVEECLRAMQHGCELHGVTLYPVLDHPGWLDDRHCPNGLWGYADPAGERETCRALIDVMGQSAPRLVAARSATLRNQAGSLRLGER